MSGSLLPGTGHSKRCRDCEADMPIEQFPPSKRNRDGRGSSCRPCAAVRSRDSYRRRAAAAGRPVRERDAVPPDGRGTYCKPCHNARGKDTYTRLYGSTREYHLRRRYGITGEQYDAMVEAQGGLCALCRERTPEHVDHDHLTGTVRGVLCSCCNQGLGNFRDRVASLRAAVDYLERTTWQRHQVSTGVFRLTSPRPAAAPSPSSSALRHLISSRRG